MVDVNKKKDRTFLVWVVDDEERVEVPAGADADELCDEALQTMLSNIDSGWTEENEEED